MLLKLAWRKLWRNKLRTSIIVFAILEMGFERIVPAMMSLSLIIEQLLIVLALLALCLLYPMWRIFRLNLVNALKGGSHAA